MIQRKSCPSATVSTTNYTWIALGTNPGLHGEKQATNHLSYVIAFINLRRRKERNVDGHKMTYFNS
jgi:hypothetical protein